MKNRMKRQQLLRLFLRVVGSVTLLALFCIFLPYSWMDGVHRWLGMGKLPEQPIVGYLARSTSAFYAMLGGLLWVVSFDVIRHRAVLIYLGVVIILVGLILFFVDWREGMPAFWRFTEGPFNIVLGAIILMLNSGRIENHR